MGGKLSRQGRVNAVAPGRLLHLQDDLSKRRYLVDTGAAYSIFPYSSSECQSGPSLRGPSGRPIRCWGEKQIKLSFNGHPFTWTFLLAEVDFPILGVDFLRNHRLAVDAAAGQLVSTDSMACFPASSSSPAAPVGVLASVLSATPASYRPLFSEFPDVVNPSGTFPPSKHGIEHHIITTGRPVTSKFRRLDSAKLLAAKLEFEQMEADGIIRRSSSCWASPLHMVRKADGSWRPCGDYRRLNLVTRPDKYPVPNMTDLASRLHGCKVFTKLDLRKGYYQIPVRMEDVPKTAVITPFGLWEFLRMPFGLRNAGQTFQRLMDMVGAGLSFVFIYLDDLLVASPDEAAHVQHLALVFQRLREYGLQLNIGKCSFGQPHVEFLGHHISERGAEPLLKHLEAVQSFPRPLDVRGLQGFLGLINFYRRFIPAAARILLPLTSALKGGKKARLDWSQTMEDAFVAAKAALCRVASLAHPDPGAAVSLACDASDTHVGAVLQQWSPQAGSLCPSTVKNWMIPKRSILRLTESC
jgi:hypothetical protein